MVPCDRLTRAGLVASSLVAAGVPVQALAAAGRAPIGTPVNVRVSRDNDSVHVDPCLVVNPRDHRNLLAACDLTAAVDTYASFDGGLTWQDNGSLQVSTGALGRPTSAPTSTRLAAA